MTTAQTARRILEQAAGPAGARVQSTLAARGERRVERLVLARMLQDADVVVVGEATETPPSVLVRGGGAGALLRF